MRPPRPLARPRWIRLVACAAALLAVAAQALIGAPAAAALPTGAWWYVTLNLPKTWTINQGSGVKVAVIDTGVQANVGDISGQVLPGPNALAQTDVPEHGTTQFGHGTDMAILIAGTGKGAGLVGVARKAKILPVAARTVTSGQLPLGGLKPDLIASGIRWAVDHGAKVINLSLGGAGACIDPERSAIAYAYQHDVIVVAGSGDSPGPVSAPANCPGAIAVGAVDSAFKPWTEEGYGPELDFVAPGYNMINEQLDGSLNGPYPDNAGTSSAAALVSGTFALLRSKFPHETARQIVARALYHVHSGLGEGSEGRRINDQLGYGEILPYFAMTEATPADAANPIYDRFAHDLPASGSSTSPSQASHAPSRPATATDPSAASTGSAASSGGGGSNTGLIVGIVVAIVVVALLIGLLLVQRRNRRTAAPPDWRN